MSLGISVPLIVPPLMEGVLSRRGHVGLRSGFVIYKRALAMLQSCPHVRVCLQNVVLRKKIYEERKRYLASDVQAEILL